MNSCNQLLLLANISELKAEKQVDSKIKGYSTQLTGGRVL